jgi:hypothetical protein
VGRYIALLAAIALPFFVLHAAVPILMTAYKTGKLAARGATYDRTKNPIVFWFGVGLWIVLIAFSIFFAVGFTIAGLAPAPPESPRPSSS